MIGKLKGVLSHIEGNIGLIETASGVSYDVFLPPNALKPPKSPIEVFTYLQVRDDALVLFGFSDRDQLAFFKMLLTVSGVGPKTAFSVLSKTHLNELLAAVRSNDVSYFTSIPGLGKKTGMKIILELSQKLKSEFKFESMHVSDDDKTAIDALISLGYKSGDAKTIISKLPANLSIEDKIKAALKRTHEKK